MADPKNNPQAPRPKGGDVFVPDPRIKDGPDPIALLERFKDEEANRADQALQLDDEHYQYYVRCHKGHKEPGIFLIGNPNGAVLGNADWFSTYHRAGAPYQLDLYCQHCAKFEGDPDSPEYTGELFQLAGIGYVFTRKRNEVLFTVAPRWVWRYAKDADLRAAEGGAHRAVRMNNEQMNHGLPAAVVQREREAVMRARPPVKKAVANAS